VRDADGRVTAVINFSTDVTEQVRARRAVEGLLAESERARADAAAALAALAESEARFRTVQDASPLGFCIHRPVRDADGAVVDFVTPYINAAGARIVGQTPERVMTERLLAIWPAAGAEGILADYARVLETGASNVRELLYEHAELAAGLTLTAVRIGDGPDAEVGVTFTDVTARLRAEAERARLVADLGAERDRLAALIREMPAPLCLLSGPDLRFAVQNDAFTRVIARGRDLTGLTQPEAFPELAGTPFHDLIRGVYATGQPWVGPETLVRFDRDGTGVVDAWFDLSYQAVRDAAGQITGVLNLAVDVTAQVRARREVERLLAESERARVDAEAERGRTTGVLEAMSDGYFALDPEFRIVAVNAAMERNVRLTRDVLLGRVFWDVFPATVGTEYERHYRAAATEGRTAHFTDAYDDGRLALGVGGGRLPGPGRGRRRVLARRHGARQGRGGARAPARRRRGGARHRRGGEPGEGRVPGRDVARAAHAAQRHRRLRGADRARHPRPGHRGAAHGPRAHPGEPAAPARAHRRGARLLRGRGGRG
jgi:PAS domain-containing protein